MSKHVEDSGRLALLVRRPRSAFRVFGTPDGARTAKILGTHQSGRSTLTVPDVLHPRTEFRVAVLVGLFMLIGCGGDVDAHEDRAAGGHAGRAPTAGTGNVSALGGAASVASAGQSGSVSAGTAGAAAAGLNAGAGSGGTAGTGGSGGSGGGAPIPAAGSAGLGGGSPNGGSAGASLQLGLPDSRCASLRPVEGASCDGGGPVLCPSGPLECVCFGLDANGPTWTCVDVNAEPGPGETTPVIGFDLGTGSGGRDAGITLGTGGNSGSADREIENPSFGLGGRVQSEFSF